MESQDPLCRVTGQGTLAHDLLPGERLAVPDTTPPILVVKMDTQGGNHHEIALTLEGASEMWAALATLLRFEDYQLELGPPARAIPPEPLPEPRPTARP